MAAPFVDHEFEEAMQRGVPYCGVRVHNDPHLSIRTNWVHGVLQGCRAERERTGAQLEH